MGEKCSETKTFQKTIGNPMINRNTLKHQLDAHQLNNTILDAENPITYEMKENVKKPNRNTL